MPIVVPDILRDCLPILAHDKQGHNRFRRTYASLKNRYHWKGMKKLLHFGSKNPCRIHAMNWSGVSNETNEDVRVYIEEYLF